MNKLRFKSLISNRYFKNIVFAILIFAIIELTLYFGFDQVIARNGNDYGAQHIRFIDYLRKSFWATGDFFPQWEMNYGLGQSFVIFSYYGLYNPLLFVMYVLPNMHVEYLLQLILLILILINTLAMTKLMYLNNIKGQLNTIVAVASSFSGVLFFHISTHPMFIYYLPIMTCSLVALHYLATESKKAGYMFAVGMIFFTNFTFAPIISIIQFLFYISILIEKKNFSFKKIIDFIMAYVVGVGMGMVMLIPTAVFMLESKSRESEFIINSPLFSAGQVIDQMSVNVYVAGISIIGLVAIIGTLFYVKKLHNYILLVPLLVINIVVYINYALNLFQYTHEKQYIMIVPIYWLLFAKLIKKVSRKDFIIISMISTIIILVFSAELKTPLAYILFIVSAILILVMVYCPKKIAYLAMIIFAVGIGISSSNLTDVELVNSKKLIEISNEYEPLRVNNKRNVINALDEFTTTAYTSLENDNYFQIVTTEYESVQSGSLRSTDMYTFDNAYFQNIFGIQNNKFDVNPIVYGVTDNQVYNLGIYKNLDSTERLYAANQAVFTEKSTNEDYNSNFNVTEIYSSNDEFTMPVEFNKSYNIPEEYQNGIMTITMHADIEKESTDSQLVYVNDSPNLVTYRDGYGINDNTTVTFIVNTYENSKLNVRFAEPNGDIIYTDVKVTYQDFNNFNNSKINVIKPKSYFVDPNNSMEFDLSLNEDGYFASTIPYANGYTITVDGEEVEIELINDLYIGAKLSKGEHHIKIEYKIPGFNIGLYITLFAIAIGFVTIILEQRLKKSEVAKQ